MIRVVIFTISSSRREQNDKSGKVLKKMLSEDMYEVVNYEILDDSREIIENKLKQASDGGEVDLILTTGGTGFGPKDVTPEATLAVVDKQAGGLSELIRAEGLKKTRKAALSRGVSGVRGETLIINLPGSPKGAGESLEAVLDLIPHALDMIKGKGH